MSALSAILTEKRLCWVGRALRQDIADRSHNNVTDELEKPHSEWTKLIEDDCTVMGIDFTEIPTVCQDHKVLGSKEVVLHVRPTVGKSVSD